LRLRVRMEMLETSFRIHRDEVTRTLIGCRLRQNGNGMVETRQKSDYSEDESSYQL